MRTATLPLVVVLLMLGSPAAARDDAIHLSWSDLINSQEAREKLDSGVRLYLAGAKTPRIVERLETDTVSKKTRSLGRNTLTSCARAALSALIAMQAEAKKRGANAVVDIFSYYDKSAFRSTTEYECHNGTMVTGVAFQGTYAKLR